jgi:hypothetical protein
VAQVPGLAGKAFATAEAQVAADGGKAGAGAEQAAAELEQAAVLGRDPVFDDADEGVH